MSTVFGIWLLLRATQSVSKLNHPQISYFCAISNDKRFPPSNTKHSWKTIYFYSYNGAEIAIPLTLLESICKTAHNPHLHPFQEVFLFILCYTYTLTVTIITWWKGQVTAGDIELSCREIVEIAISSGRGLIINIVKGSEVKSYSVLELKLVPLFTAFLTSIFNFLFSFLAQICVPCLYHELYSIF